MEKGSYPFSAHAQMEKGYDPTTGCPCSRLSVQPGGRIIIDVEPPTTTAGGYLAGGLCRLPRGDTVRASRSAVRTEDAAALHSLHVERPWFRPSSIRDCRFVDAHGCGARPRRRIHDPRHSPSGSDSRTFAPRIRISSQTYTLTIRRVSDERSDRVRRRPC